LQAAKIMRRFFYEAPAEIMRNYTTRVNYFTNYLNNYIDIERKRHDIMMERES